MTTQRRTLIEPKDIVGIEYECAHCETRYLVQLHRFDRRVDHCPNCREKWLDEATRPEGTPPAGEMLTLFVDYLAQLQTRKLGVTVRLQLAEPRAEDDAPAK